jgi:hypothetical protein
MFVEVELKHAGQTPSPRADKPLVQVHHTPRPWYVCRILAIASRYVDPALVEGDESKDGGMLNHIAATLEWLEGQLGCGRNSDTNAPADVHCRSKLAPSDAARENHGTAVCEVHGGLAVYYHPTISVELRADLHESRPQVSLRHCVEVSPVYFVRLIVGIVLVRHAWELAMYRPFHYVLMAALSLSCSLVIAAVLVLRSINRGTSIWGASLSRLGGLAYIVLPSFLVPKVWQTVEWLLWTLPAELMAVESIGPVPHPGKIALLCTVLCSAYLTKTRRVFLGDDNDDESSGLSLCGCQLARAIKWIGVGLIVSGTANPEFGCLLAATAIMHDEISHAMWVLYMSIVAQNARARARFHGRELQTASQFERDADPSRSDETSVTSIALRQLRQHILQNQDVLRNVRRDNRSNVREFMDGYADIELPDNDDKNNGGFMAWMCKCAWLLARMLASGSVVLVFYYCANI